MNLRNSYAILGLALFLIFFPLGTISTLNAQRNELPIECGDILPGELTPSNKDQRYTVQVSPGTSISIRVEPIGQTFNPSVSLRDASGAFIAGDGSGWGGTAKAGQADEILDLVVSSTNPILRVEWGFNRSIGGYEVSLGCILRDGTIINPGDNVFNANSTQLPNSQATVGEGNFTDNPFGTTTASTAPAFSGIGFPGLAPVDFSAVAKIPTVPNIPMTGGIAPTGDTILGYIFDAAANDTLALNFTRVSGNLNLGLVVLSADNKVVFQASLVTSSELSTKFTLPTAGTYTIGIFRIDLLPPDAPEATAFQLTATLNP